MRAVVMKGYGGADVTAIIDLAPPVAGPSQILIDVEAAGLNPVDFKIRDGKLRLVRKLTFPSIMGNELAGVVRAVGAEVTSFVAGDFVFVRVGKDNLGAFAEQAVVEAAHAAKKPRTLTMTEAAGVPLAALTAWQALHEELGIKGGQKVFIPAGAGGVGSLAIQIAKLAGATVATTASAGNHALVKDLGADVVIDYRTVRFEDVLKDYDAVLDTMGGDSLDRSFQILKRGGAVCSIAGAPEPGTARRMDAGPVVGALFWALSAGVRRRARRFGVRYSYMFMRPDGAQLKIIGDLIDAGKMRALVDKVYPLAEHRQAFAYLETGRAKGKVILEVRDGAKTKR